ncbi:MAG: hypothetical protein IIA73_06315 [Proteobacteria bacterium]|nr:hypothetical protein [Pseudomonadota bacterium]
MSFGSDAAADAEASERPPRIDPDDAFIARFLARIPRDIAQSFSDAQLEAIVAAFGTRRWRDHPIDIRLTIPLVGRAYYLVVLAGAERRSRRRRRAERIAHPFVTLGNAIFAAVFFTGVLFSLFAALYVLKSLLGIDLLPGMSLGVMPALKEQLDILLN